MRPLWLAALSVADCAGGGTDSVDTVAPSFSSTSGVVDVAAEFSCAFGGDAQGQLAVDPGTGNYTVTTAIGLLHGAPFGALRGGLWLHSGGGGLALEQGCAATFSGVDGIGAYRGLRAAPDLARRHRRD